MAQHVEAGHIVNDNEGEDDIGLSIVAQVLGRRYSFLGESSNIRRYLEDLEARACALKNDFIREKSAYEADPQNLADNFALHIRLFNIVLESIKLEIYDYEVELERYVNCNHRSEGETICNPMRNVTQTVNEITDLIEQMWSSDMEERIERQKEREITEVVEGLPSMRIQENNVDEINCPICLSGFEEKAESCHLRCHERHIFHRDCIKQWLKRQNQCPSCRWPAYMWAYWRKYLEMRMSVDMDFHFTSSFSG